MDDITGVNANVTLTGIKMEKGIIYQSSSKMGEEGTEIAISSYILYFFWYYSHVRWTYHYVIVCPWCGVG